MGAWQTEAVREKPPVTLPAETVWEGRPAGQPAIQPPLSMGPPAGPPESSAGLWGDSEAPGRAGSSGDILQLGGLAENEHCAASQETELPTPPQTSAFPGAVEKSPFQASVSPRVSVAWDAPSVWRGCSGSPHMGRRAQAEGLHACPLWAPQPAPVPFLNVNEQTQECLPHSWLRQARAGGAGREEMALPALPDPPALRQATAGRAGDRQGDLGQDRPF